MAQNENISLSLANKVDILNKSQSVDARYGVYDTEEDALDAMALYGLDGRQVAVYSDKVNGKVKLYLYNQVEHKLEPIANFEDLTAENISFNDTTTQLGVSNTQGAIEKTNERIDNLGTMSNESASDYTKTEDLADVALSNDYNDLDNKPTPLTNEDLTIFIDENNVIWSNISDHTEEFTANGTDRNFVSDVDFASIGAVYINGVKIKRDDYLVISESEIEIKETVTLLENDFVEIFGSIFVI